MGERLREKRCLIVGGTTGLGFAAARRFLEEGASVVIGGRDADKGRAAHRDLASLGPGHFLAFAVSIEDQVDRLVHETQRALGRLDVLYHVAGMSGRRFGDGSLHKCTLGGWIATLD